MRNWNCHSVHSAGDDQNDDTCNVVLDDTCDVAPGEGIDPPEHEDPQRGGDHHRK